MVSKLPIKMMPVASEEHKTQGNFLNVVGHVGAPGKPHSTTLIPLPSMGRVYIYLHEWLIWLILMVNDGKCREVYHAWMLWDRIHGGPLLAKKFSDHPGVSQFVINPQHTGSLGGNFLPTLRMVDLLVLEQDTIHAFYGQVIRTTVIHIANTGLLLTNLTLLFLCTH